MDGENEPLAVALLEIVPLAVTLRENVVVEVSEGVCVVTGEVDASLLRDTLLERVSDKVTDRVRDAVGNDTVTLADSVGDLENDNVRDAERLKLCVVLGVTLEVAVSAADTDGDTLALASHWQQAFWLTLQSTSATAPLAKAPGARTLIHAPAPVGAACPAVGVPHQLSFVA